MTIIIDPRQRFPIDLDEDGVPETERASFDVRPLSARHDLYLEEVRDRTLAALGITLADVQTMTEANAVPTPATKRASLFVSEMVTARLALAIVGWRNVKGKDGKPVPIERVVVDVFGVPEEAIAPHLLEALGAERRFRLAAKLVQAQTIPEEVAQGF